MSEIVRLEREADNLQTDLLISLNNNDFEEFKRILRRLRIEKYFPSGSPCIDDIDINHLYGHPENKTLLDIACSNTNKAPFVKYLLDSGAKVNLINHRLGAAPIHLAVANSDFDTVRLLVEHEDINIHQPNTAGQTAFHLAAQHKRNDFIELLQGRKAFEIEQAKIKVRKHQRRPARYKYNDHDEISSLRTPKVNDSSDSEESLSSLLKCRNYQAFKSKANAHNAQFVDDALGFTYLQYACKFGLTEFVELLLDLNVDPNQTDGNRMTPIIIAAYEGYHEIVQLLQNTGIIAYDLVGGKNILHFIMQGYYRLEDHTAERLALAEWLDPVYLKNGGKKDYAKCLKLILNNMPDSQLNVDMLDERGNTPLYYAIVYDNRDMILSLMERGAYIGAQNQNGDLLIKLMKPATLEYFLDESMCTTTLYRYYNRTVFNYNWLTRREQRSNRTQTNETNLLKALSQVSDLRPLLKHPLFLVFLDFKWHIIMKKLFYIDLGFYVQFVFSVSVYLLIAGPVAAENPRILASLLAVFFWVAVFVSNSILLLKEFAQLIIYSKANRYKYIADLQNYMEIILIIIVYVILFEEIQSNQVRTILAATVIFLSYVQLILLVLNHPIMSIHIEMFKVVASNTFTFLMSYVILILAFAFTFFLLFKNVESKDKSKDESKDKPFNNILKAIFKTLIMSTGEYEIMDFLISDNYGIGHLVFILFIFLIPIVLFNLLNAIAVSDIRGIRKEAELVNTVARVQLIAHMEEVISASFSLLQLIIRLANYCIHNTMGKRPFRPIKCGHILEKQYYYTNYFGVISTCREIIYRAKFRDCCIIENPFDDNNLIFVVSPSTEQSIREKCAETSKEEKVTACHKSANSTPENAYLQEICKSLITLKNGLEKTDEKYQLVEQVLTKINKLSNQKSK